jgi:hypothetical protein
MSLCSLRFFYFGSRSMRCVVMVALRKQLICAAMFLTRCQTVNHYPLVPR